MSKKISPAVKRFEAVPVDEAEPTPNVLKYPQYTGKSVAELARAQDAVKKRLEAMEAEVSTVRQEYEYLRTIALPNTMEAAGLENCIVKGLGRVSLSLDMHCSLKPAHKDEAYEWLKDHGMGALIAPYVQPSTLKAAIKQRIRDGEEVPEDYFTIFAFTRASITKN